MALILSHKCFECDFEDEIKTENRKVICPKCNTTNDFWLDGEEPPENHRNEYINSFFQMEEIKKMKESDFDVYYIICSNQQDWLAVKSTLFGHKYVKLSGAPTKFDTVQQAIEHAVKRQIFNKVNIVEVKETRKYENVAIPRRA